MMRKLFAVVVMLAGMCGPAAAATSDIARNAVNGFIIPAYERFAGEAQIGEALFDALCAVPDAPNLQMVQDQFRAIVIAWSRVEAVRFGPILQDNRLERILFWPDRRSRGLRQVQGVLATKDETATSLESLQQKSVALQGLGALEYVLFGTGYEELATADGAFRCSYGRTITQALAAIGEATAEDWLDPDGTARHLIDPSPEWDDYRTETEVLQELVGIWVHGAELIRDTRILPFFKETVEDTDYRSALFWRSDMTIPSMRANVAGLRDLFIVSGLSDALEEGNRWAGGSFLFEMQNFDRTAGEIDLPISEAVTDTDGRAKINYLFILTRSLQNLAVEQIAFELGLNVGFSALDGD